MKPKLSLRFLHKPIMAGLKSITTKLLLILALSPALCALSQIPQGFNYQAVARNASGSPIINTSLPVRITIQSDSLGGTIFWQELHSSITTNSLGVINLVLGKGARQSVSTVAAFSAIDWSQTPKFLKTEIDYSGWKTMGVSRLWSVPYAMIANDFDGPVKKLAVKGETASLEEPLFEVKNKDGQTVFAVYNEGVRVYVSNGDKGLKGGFAVGGFGTDKAESTKYLFVDKDSVRVYLDTNPLTKKLKGGFAVGGYDLTKGIVQDYLDVNSDSVRIYIDSDPTTKKLKGGFAVGGYDMTKGTNTNYMNVNTDATGIINPAQNRILWYPLKNAFLTGKVLIVNKDSVGENSFASGFESKARGHYSQALGYQAIARGDYSTSIGHQSIAAKPNSFAFGQFAQARNEETYAFGRGAIAEGFRSYAFGSAGVDSAGSMTGVAYSKGDYSFAIGQGSQAIGKGSLSIGISDTAMGGYSVTLGYSSSNKGWYATSIGAYNKSSGAASTAIGYSTVASGSYSTAFGREANASGMYSIAMGLNSKASGESSTSIGRSTEASGFRSSAFGISCKAQGECSTAIGYGAITTTTGSNSVSLGSGQASGESSTALGYNARSLGARSVAIGSAEVQGYAARALGYVAEAYGNYSTAIGSWSRSLGAYSTAIGDHPEAQATSSTAFGYYTVTGGAYSTALGANTWTLSGYETVVGRYNTFYTPVSSTGWDSNDRLFVIGNGTSISPGSNALTVLKNGRMGLQTVTSPTYALELPNNSTIGVGQARAYAWATYSDGRAKSEQTALSYGLEEIMKLSPSEYFHHGTVNDNDGIIIQDEGKHDIGLIAQDVYDIIPEAVNKPENEDKELWSISYDKLVPVLVNAIKEQQEQIDELKDMIFEMKREIASSSGVH